ncbi:MAG: HypC/HybG/HupF family hydrogenase formation chaperone [Actinobacteria bacterium]|jgi:hydrogenase maturation factor|nr:HypC/HybG/HupF family hydrogenase formation chaperone [Actinomycetota bacterium]MCL6094364.1 HypC/HybG/HupF family hydrogenase formation chaperone [Actinomycetota bacterium]
MCISRFYQVISVKGSEQLVVNDLSGRESLLSMLAWTGELPSQGDWIVAHSGYALNKVDRTEAEVAVKEWRQAVAMLGEQTER